MKKRVLALMCVAALSLSLLAACGSQPAETAEPAPETETTTETEETTETETAEVETTSSDDEAEYFDEIPLTLVNNTGFDVYELYISDSNEDTWGENQIPDDKYMGNGDSVEIGTLSFYADDAYWDIQLVEEDGTEHDFYDIDMNLSSKDGIVVSFNYDDVSGDYTFNIDSAE